MEYPPLVAGRTALFAVHLTKLADFQPLTAGRPRIEFTPESGGAAKVVPGSEPSRPGAFRVEGAAPPAGRYQWALVIEAPGLADRHELGSITVHADERSANADAEKQSGDDPSAIAYLKEQQWTNTFATEQVREVELRSSLRVPAAIEPISGGEAIVAAPAAGRFTADSLISIGATVRAGQALGRLEPRLAAGGDRATLAAEVAEARATSEAAHAEQARAERLLTERAVPARRVEDARRAVAVADARLQAAEARLTQRDETLGTGGGLAAGNAFVLRAPIAGRVADVMATLGASYDEGAPLFRIIRTDRLELRAQVPASDVAAVRDVAGLALEIPGRPDPLMLEPHHRHDAGVIDPTTRRAAGAVRGRQSRWTATCRSDRHRLALQQAPYSRDSRAQSRCPARSRSSVRIRPARRRTICAPLYRHHHAGRRLGRREGRSEDRRSRRDPWRVRSAARLGRQGIAGRRPRALRGIR